MSDIDGVVLRRTPSSGAEQLDLQYGRHWVIRSTHGIKKYRFHQWRKERADHKDARAAGIEGDLDFDDDD